MCAEDLSERFGGGGVGSYRHGWVCSIALDIGWRIVEQRAPMGGRLARRVSSMLEAAGEQADVMAVN